MLENSFIIYKADRSDVRSKSVLKALGKYTKQLWENNINYG